jgi:hypothetical protein
MIPRLFHPCWTLRSGYRERQAVQIQPICGPSGLISTAHADRCGRPNPIEQVPRCTVSAVHLGIFHFKRFLLQ